MQKDYLERVYAGFLGMNVGIRLGAPVEPNIWSYERIKETYGDIRGYVKDYINFAADDDANGPVYFFRALRDSSKNGELTPEYVAKAWLNYAREGIGMFWWGGYGVSTEHTAYLNLLHGIPAPLSGSAKTNGKLLADQIGGQIFIDTWGLVWPGQPTKAADYAEAAASVSHDGEGLAGARFMAAAIAAAFVETDIAKVIERALEEVPAGSLYTAVSRAVIAHHAENPNDWESCLHMLHRDWGYDKYGGVCHMIPNAGVCVLAMLYGAGDFARTVEIATMCSWDTDCNAGNVGTILGVMTGLAGIPDHYRKPINDGIVLSGVTGYLNILDFPTYAKELARTGYALAGEEAPAELETTDGELYFDFELPGSTHNFRTSDPFLMTVKNSEKKAFAGKGSLCVLVDRMVRGQGARIFYKPFYTRADFSDERYKPAFSPQVYSGQTMEMQVYFDKWFGWDSVQVTPYFRTMSDKKLHTHGFTKVKPDAWQKISCVIEDTQGDLIDEIGLIIEGDTPSTVKTIGEFYIDEFRVYGKAEYTVDMAKQRKELATITPFIVNHGAWEVEEGRLNLMCYQESLAYTGNYYSRDLTLHADVEVANGDNAVVLLRARGAMQSYMAGFDKGEVCIWKQDFGLEKLASAPFALEQGRVYALDFTARGDALTLSVDGGQVLEVRDGTYTSGMWGLGAHTMGRSYFGGLRVKEL
ncbi:MAG: ADP-ribosylglycohydrolase family protein [Oscillibacter sp.]|nr:ADP-ribosylglycohydrolase family protein [Oscillibacter sp.]